jgi:thymidine kinase
VCSGQTGELLWRLRRAGIAGQDVAVVTFAVDDPTVLVGAGRSNEPRFRNGHTLRTA